MTFTTDELRKALHAYADDVPLPEPAALVAGAERKRNHARKVRAAVIAGGAAVLMAVVTVIGMQGIGHEKALTPAQLNKKHHTHYADYTHGLKLTDIVDVPVHTVPDTGSLPPETPSSGRVDVTLPDVGEAVYLQCDPRYFVDTASADGNGIDPSVEGLPNGNVSCSTFGGPMLVSAKPGERGQLWLATTDKHKNTAAPVAVYTEVAWKDYPATTHALRPKPSALDPKQPPYGTYAEVISGSGSRPSSKTIRVPVNADSLGAALTLRPSTTGRFQVLVDGRAQRLDYFAGLPAGRDVFRLFNSPPEVRGTWFDYFPDSGEDRPGIAQLRAAPAGKTVTITIRAVDTTGPWQAMLSWQKK